MKFFLSARSLILGLLVLFLFTFIFNISFGSVSIPLKTLLSLLFRDENIKSSWNYIVMDYRLPKALTATFVGMGLSVSGLFMQTLFRNPLAGPYVLGISSGASLGVALLILGNGLIPWIIPNQWSLTLAAALGSLLVLISIMMISVKLREVMGILIVGLMFGSLSAALVGILSFFSSAPELQRFVFWSLGSMGNLGWDQLGLFTGIIILGILMAISQLKHLNAILLGDDYAISLGVPLRRTRWIIILTTSILAGGITSFVGPIAFVGLAVPHLMRLLLQTHNPRVLFPAVCLGGSSLMLICDSLAQLPWMEQILPINSVTALVGAPIVIWLLLGKRKLIF